MRLIVILILLIAIQANAQINSKKKFIWKRLSTEYGDIPMPNDGKYQTATLLADITGNGVKEFIIVEKTGTPSVYMYMHIEGEKWNVYAIDKRRIDAAESIAAADIDGDGDLDIAVGSDSGPEIWWWENPAPMFKDSRPWKRNYIKKEGASTHHDMIFGDFDGDKQIELAFWNQGAKKLFVANKPKKLSNDNWPLTEIYSYSTDGQSLQRSNGTELLNVGPNHHEGINVADLDKDGIDDILAGGMWFNFSNGKYQTNSIDPSYVGARIAGGQLIMGSRPEIVMVAGEGNGPLVFYKFDNHTWTPKIIDNTLRRAHTLHLIDFNKDGLLDIYVAEMKTKSINNPGTYIYFNNDEGNFEKMTVSKTYGTHNGGIGDITGNGEYDIVNKPYAWDAPRIDLWINGGER